MAAVPIGPMRPKVVLFTRSMSCAFFFANWPVGDLTVRQRLISSILEVPGLRVVHLTKRLILPSRRQTRSALVACAVEVVPAEPASQPP